MKRLYIDTESMGLAGLPFLIQIGDGAGPATLFHVLDHPPRKSLELLDNLCRSDVELVAFNATFDLKMLSKLATVATLVGDAWSFERAWNAERLWRPETPFDERLKALRLAYPGRTADMMVAAQSLPPLEEQFLNPPVVTLPMFPVAAVPEFLRAVRSALARRPYLSGSPCGLDVADRLRARVTGADTKVVRDRVRRAQQSLDYTYLGEVRLSLERKGIYTLKSVAKVLGFPGPISPFEFLDGFGRIPESYSPTYQDRELYGRLWDYVQRRQHDPDFLQYAVRDVDMLVHSDRHYRRQPGFNALEHDFAMVPLLANLELCGVHIDVAKLAETVQYYRERVADSDGFLKEAGLENFNSGPKVVGFINRILNRHLSAEELDAINAPEDSQKATLASLLAELKLNGHGGDGHLVKCVEHIIRARTFSRRPEFFKRVIGDTLYPHFLVRGTVTDRMTTSRPSVQNMPVRATDEEKDDHVAFRAPFVPPPGYRLLVGDADQFEMRLVAAVAHEYSLIEGFLRDEDPHTLTALRTLGDQVRESDPTVAGLDDTQLSALFNAKDPRVKDFRATAKTLNFATIYGSTEYGIARQSGKTPDEARRMLNAFFDAYPSIKVAVDETHGRLQILSDPAAPFGQCTVLSHAKDTRIANRLGVSRSFELALRLVQILARLGGFQHLREYLPRVACLRQPLVRYYDGLKPPGQVVASQCRSAARRLQRHCQRQAFNFLVQSLGAAYIKQLQVRLLRRFVQPGIHVAADLDVLPGINVHDEIHVLVKDSPRGVRDETQSFVNEVSAALGVPIKFEFDEVNSWADKA